MKDEIKKEKLSTEPYKGVRDFYPVDMAIQEYIFDTWRKTVESFGYEEYGSSVLEPSSLYKSKTSEEIVNDQTYTFIDRGEREVTLRPEITPSVARMVAGKKRELAFPLRWYSIPNLYRYEQPQRGRIREFWQLNVDLFGVDAIEADIEVIQLAYKIMKAFGAKDEDFEIRINDRKAAMTGLDGLELSPDQNKALMKLIDKKSKIPKDKYLASVKEIVGKDIDPSFEQTEQVKKVLDSLKKSGVTNARFDDSIVRGFDYYTGVVFEIYDTNPENRRALFGGGRYDDLTSLFGGDRTPAVGFGMGDVTMRDFLETRGLLPSNKTSSDYYICVMSENQADFAMKVADDIRNKGSRVAVDYSYRKLGDQIKSADKRSIPKVIVIGEEEAKTGKIKVKDMKSGEENELKL